MNAGIVICFFFVSCFAVVSSQNDFLRDLMFMNMFGLGGRRSTSQRSYQHYQQPASTTQNRGQQAPQYQQQYGTTATRNRGYSGGSSGSRGMNMRGGFGLLAASGHFGDQMANTFMCGTDLMCYAFMN